MYELQCKECRNSNGGDRALEPRAAIDDEELGPPQAAPDEIVEDRAPGLGALAAHLFDRQKHLLAVLAHPDDNEQRDGSGFAVEPHAHHGAVENQPHDWLLGQRAGVPCVPVALHLAPHRLTVSLPTSPPNTLRSARRTRRVLVPARYAPAISASAARARR